jgi:hypothetical protein
MYSLLLQKNKIPLQTEILKKILRVATTISFNNKKNDE